MRKFSGLKEMDFAGIAGTTWRGRQNEDSLARVVVERMRNEGSGLDYDSWAMGRFPALMVAAREHFSYADSLGLAKFAIWLKADEASFGLWVEKLPPKPGGPEHWEHLLEHLESRGDDTREVLVEVMHQHHLQLWIGHSNTRWVVLGEELRLLPELQTRLSWSEMLNELRRIPAETWSVLYVARFVPKTQAIALGGEIASLMGDVFLDLEPIYLVTVR